MNEKCYFKCVPKPSTSLSSSEEVHNSELSLIEKLTLGFIGLLVTVYAAIHGSMHVFYVHCCAGTYPVFR